MRTPTTLFTTALLATSLNAQTTGLDFTANDCDGLAHHLFADLEAGNAVVIDLVMMSCSPCVVASNGIVDNVIPNTSDPSRVKFYSIGFTNSIDCTQMNDWKNTNGFTHTVFAGMSAQTTYYGGMGMPTVIVLGGGYGHGVYYNELGYAASDNAALIAAINAALADANAVQEAGTSNVTVGPNPVVDVLNVNGAWTDARVLDLQGRELLRAQVIDGRVNVQELPAGAYVLQLTGTTGATGTSRFEKR